MAIHWKFKSYLAQKHAIYTVTELRDRISSKTGYVISVGNLCKYVNKRPNMLRLETIEIICSSLDCGLSDFLKVTPKKFKQGKSKKLSYKNTPRNKRGVNSFPDPDNYKK